MAEQPAGGVAADAEHKRAIRAFLVRELDDDSLRDDEDIFEAGYVNSLFAMELVTFIEGTFDMTIDNEDLELENFSSVERIAALVESKAGALSPR